MKARFIGKQCGWHHFSKVCTLLESVFTSEFTSEVKSNKLSVVTFRFDSIFFQHGNFFFYRSD